jgi:hypothetical protein
MCPNCKQNAPIVYRGTLAYCTACGAPRPPFSAKAVNLAGQPSKIGGSVAKFFGWMILGGGLLLAVCLLIFFQLIFGGAVGWAVGLPIALLSAVIGGLILFGGSKLATSGVETERAAKFEAIWAIALARGGLVTALDVGRSLNMAPDGADTLLTEMTKKYPDYVSIEVDDAGNLFYKVTGVAEPPGSNFGVRYRVEQDGRVRIADELAGGRALQEQAEYEAWAEQHRKRHGR